MKRLNTYFFGNESISLEDAAYTYGVIGTTVAIALYTIFSIY
ncbi:hypothetical protein [Planococcus sp. 107-1]|nr:hypothetical protein [Planococcus sp. 107-1]